MRRALVAALLLAAGCQDHATELRAGVASDLPLTQMSLSIVEGMNGAQRTFDLPSGGGPPTLPGVVVVRLADTDEQIVVTLQGTSMEGDPMAATTTLGCIDHETCTTQLTLQRSGTELGAPCVDSAECASGFCVGMLCCSRACDGACETCRQVEGAPSDGACTARAKDVVCRASAGSCDVEDVCDGVTGDCVDHHIARDVVCRAAVAACDQPESCNGKELECPPDETSCPDGQYCASSGCVPKQAPGAACGDAAMCATGFCVDGTCCATACTGGQHDCQTCGGLGANRLGAGTCTRYRAGDKYVCRASTDNGVCDPAEMCDGNSDSCPTNLGSVAASATFTLQPTGFGTIETDTSPVQTNRLSLECVVAGAVTNPTHVFLSYATSALPVGSRVYAASVISCVQGGTAGGNLCTTSFPLPLISIDYDKLPDVTFKLPSSADTPHAETRAISPSLVKTTSNTQLTIRFLDEAVQCATPTTHRTYFLGGSNPACPGTTALNGPELAVQYCPP